MAYLGDIIRILKNEPVQMNEANILPIMRQGDGSIGTGDERVLVVKEMLGGMNAFVSGKMKVLLLKIADGTVGAEYVRKNMDMLRGINNDKQNLTKVASGNIMAMTSCEDVVSALLGKKVQGSSMEIPSASDEERRTEDGLEHFYERVRDACRKVFKKDGYRILLDKLDACHYIEKVYDRNHVVIAKVTSHEGAVGVGAFGASWCTCVAGANSDNMYDHYAKNDLKIVFVDRDDDRNSIWQLSENEGSWCMAPNDMPDENNMIAAIIEVSDGENTARDIIDAIDNGILSKWLDEEFEISEKGIKTDIEYDRKDIRGYCIVTRKFVVNGRSLVEMYNFCKSGFREVSEAELLLPEWFDYIEYPKDGLVKVRKDEEWNLFDLKMNEFMLPEWVHYIGYLSDRFATVMKDERHNLFDMKTKEFLLPEWFDQMDYPKDGVVNVKKDGKYNLFDLNTKKAVFPEWVDHVGYSKDGFFEVKKDLRYNLFDLKTREFVLPEWVDYVADSKDGFIKVEKDLRYNLFDLKTREFVLPEWIDEVRRLNEYESVVRVQKDGKYNLFDLKTKKLVLPEWAKYIEGPRDGFVGVLKDRKYNLFDMKTKEIVLPEWFDYVDYPKDGSIQIENGGKYNLFDMKTKEIVLPEWFDYVDHPKDGVSIIIKDGKQNLFELKTNEFMLPEWVDQVDHPKDGFVDIGKDGKWQKIKLSDLRKTESRRRRCKHRICECCGRRIC